MKKNNEDRIFEFNEMVKEAERKLKIIDDIVVDELNGKHAVVHTDQFYILTEKPHILFEGTDFTLESKQSFINTYENQRVACSDGQTRNKAKVWLSHSERRQYQGINFDPSTLEHAKGFYNIWKGFAIKSLKGSCELYKKHIMDVICSGNPKYFLYVWKWMAHLTQHPDQVATSLVLMGLQGTGKGVFVKALGKIFGQHFLHLDNLDRLLGNFNFHMKNAVLVFGDEAIWGGNKKDIGKLKAMVTEEYAMIEPKGKDSFAVRNFRHFILSSNEDWPIHLDSDDRRFLVLKISNIYKEDISYFKAIANELENGGYEALLFDLLNEDISAFDPRNLPANTDAFEVKLQSASSAEQYIYYALLENCFDLGNATPSGIWRERITFDSIYSDYTLWCSKQHIPIEKKPAIGKAFHKLLPSILKSRPAANGPRPEYYTFQTCARTREDFQKSFKVGIEIWEL